MLDFLPLICARSDSFEARTSPASANQPNYPAAGCCASPVVAGLECHSQNQIAANKNITQQKVTIVHLCCLSRLFSWWINKFDLPVDQDTFVQAIHNPLAILANRIYTLTTNINWLFCICKNAAVIIVKNFPYTEPFLAIRQYFFNHSMVPVRFVQNRIQNYI